MHIAFKKKILPVACLLFPLLDQKKDTVEFLWFPDTCVD